MVTEVCENVVGDFVLILDSSGSICHTDTDIEIPTCDLNWGAMLNMVVTLVRSLYDTSEYSRVGLITFAENANNVFFLNTYNTEASNQHFKYSLFSL